MWLISYFRRKRFEKELIERWEDYQTRDEENINISKDFASARRTAEAIKKHSDKHGLTEEKINE